MKLAGEHNTGMGIGRSPLSVMPIVITHRVLLMLVVAMIAAGLVVFYYGFENESLQLALDALSWCLIAALAIAALVMCVKVIDGFLDA